MLSGYSVAAERESGDKVTRAEPFASQWQIGNVDVLIAPWNNTLFGELEGFPELKHDDIVDACSGAFNNLHTNAPSSAPPTSTTLTKNSYWNR
jgi:predicted phage terminase large subunit-like protein